MFHSKVAPQYHYLCKANEAHSGQNDVPTGPQAGQDRFADWHVEPRKNEMKAELVKAKDKASKELYLKLCVMSEELSVKLIHLYI